MQLAVMGGSGLLSGGGLFRVAILGASIAGSLLLNGRKKPVGKLNDVRVSSSTYGRGIARIWGTMRTTGNMFWATDFIEEKYYMTQKGKEKTGSKGKMKAKKGKATPMYRYYANFAMGMCEGPIDEVLRVWADNNLIFNKYNPDDDDLVGPGFSEKEDDDSSKSSQMSKSGKKGNDGHGGSFTFRVYKGTETQTPDPYMEEVQGVGEVPAYRDLCYLMFEKLALQDFGNRIPTITAEIATNSETKPMQLGFTNLDPPSGGWYREFYDPYIIDVRHNRIYVGAILNGGAKVIRVYNMKTRMEIDRIDFRDTFEDTEIPWFTGGWGVLDGNEYKNRIDIQGVTPNGDLVGYSMTGNLGTLFFITPKGKPIYAFGIQGNYGTGAQIFAQAGAFPALAQGRNGIAGVIVIPEVFGRYHVFDEKYVRRMKVDYGGVGGGRKGNFIVGPPGTDQALFCMNTDYNQNGQFKIFSSPLDLPVDASSFESAGTVGGTDYGGDSSAGFEPSLWKEFAKWPEQAGREGNIMGIRYFSFVNGANCVALIAGAPGNEYVVKFDALTGDVVWEEKMPTGLNYNLGGFTNPPNWNNTNYLNFYTTDGVFVKVDFANETVEWDSSPSGIQYPNNNHPRFYWSERDAMIAFAPSKADPAYLAPTIIYQDRKIQNEVNIGDICRDVALLVGIPDEQIDVSMVENQEPLIGWMMEQPTEARQVIQDLADVFQFDAVETDYMIKFISRGQDPVLTIQPDMLGVVESSDFDVENEKLVETFMYELDLPDRVTLSFFNAKKDYETGSQYFKRPSKPLPVMSTKDHLEITLPAALVNSTAKKLAKRILYSAWSERHSVEWTLPRDYIYLDPTDVVNVVTDDGRTLQLRITDMELGSNLEMKMSGVANYADSYKHSAVADADRGLVKQPKNGKVEAMPLVFNIPYISDDHEDPRTTVSYYWGAAAYEFGFNFGVMQSQAEGSNWKTEGYTTLDMIWGTVNGAVPAPANGWNIEDEKTEIILTPAFDFNNPTVVYTWESVTDDNWPSEQNMIVIGEEIILFKNVEELPNGNVKISRLIRGYRGSIDAAYRHVGAENWALVLPGTMFVTSDNLDYLNKTQNFFIDTGFSPFTIGGSRYTMTKATPERPLPVGDVRRTNTGTDVKLDWSRATRIGGALKDGTGNVPLNEEAEKYKVFLLDQPYDAKTFDPDDSTKYIWESAELTSPTVTITGSTLTTLAKSNTMDLHFVIYQLSESVGWGLPHGLTLPYTRY